MIETRSIKGFDASAPVTEAHIPKLLADGFKFRIGYSRIGNGGLTPKELELLFKHGFHVGVVFQNKNNDPREFTKEAAKRDYNAAMEDAERLKMPVSGAIYYAVDFQVLKPTASFVLQYFEYIAEMDPEYPIGCYGNDYALHMLTDAGLIDMTWRPNAAGWATKPLFGDPEIQQQAEIKNYAPGLAIDPNLSKDFALAGLWKW